MLPCGIITFVIMVSFGTAFVSKEVILMKFKTDLLKNYISEYINQNIDDFIFDECKIADTTAINILAEIQSIIKKDEYSDFEIVEEIICIFEKYNIDFGNCHNFV